jgi:hypothetical protein
MTPFDPPPAPVPAYDQYWASVEEHPPADPGRPTDPAADAYATFHAAVEG